MSEKIAFIADSCADLPQEILEREYVFSLPVLVMSQGKEYRDGIDITAEFIYERQKEGELPSTSLPTGEMVETLLKDIVSKGYRKAVVVTMSSAISGTWNFCKLLCGENEELECIVFDSGMASLAEGAILIEAMDEVERGTLSWEGFPARLEYLKAHTCPYFGIDTLEFLQKNGRIGKAAALAGNLLNIMPVLSFDENGVITPIEKVRGTKKRLHHLMGHAVEKAKEFKKYRLYFVNGGCLETAKELEKLVLSELSELPEPTEILHSALGCALAVHLGRNLVGVCVQAVD